MANANETGVYTLDGARFWIKKGDKLPDGAAMDGAAGEPETPEAAVPKAEKKAAQTGPSETIEAAAAPSETA